MPFSSLPSSPGFVPPQAPDWTRFGAQANEFIQRGGELRARAGEQFSESIQKAAEQISGILQYHSPEEKAKRELQRLHLEYLTGVYNDYKKNPNKYQMSANGPVLIDPLERYAKIVKVGRDVAYINSLGSQNELPPNVKQAIDRINAIKSGRAKVSQATEDRPDTEALPGSTDYGSELVGGSTAPPPEDFNATETQ